MFIKTLTVAAMATIAAVSAQAAVPNHTYFTAPVGTSAPYAAGKNTTFSWTATCIPPSDMTAPVPTKVPVQLVDAANGDNAVFLADVTTIDCTQPMGNTYWTPPGNFPNTTPSSGSILTPILSGAAVIAASAAMMYL
ncbi:hypothetical protein BG006_008249 [Podila minutissima]|uniref:Uncharacterized protein n=1 Tax=Podila minutissima TaxID=64525 RepID=A0A9P5SR63_9FUNG|nr:hypothetical protein BG006_008238 [Podila minutissima]KAF9336566.1 hypothetical protein BG006_008249 [Podila minutissima]